MRFNSANVLLSLAALSNLPTGLGRALPNSAVEQYNRNYIRAAPVRIQPIEPVKPVKPPPGRPNSDKPDGETSSPSRIGSPDKTPDNPSEQPVRIGVDDNNTPDLWCRGSGCGGGKKLLTNEELSARGTKGVNLVSSPSKGKDYAQQEKENYRFNKDEDFYGVDDSIPKLGYEKKYGFTQKEEDWQTMFAQSKDNPADAVVSMSVGRGTKDGKDYVAIVAHERKAKADGNRYKLDKNGDNVNDKDGNAIENPDKDTKAVPAAQLLHDAAKQSGKLDGKKPEKIFLISENVINEEAKIAIPNAHKLMKSEGKPLTLKKGAPGVEGEQFNIIAGTDNNYSYLNTVGRNPDTFKDYEVVSIETHDTNPFTMSMELGKKQ